MGLFYPRRNIGLTRRAPSHVWSNGVWYSVVSDWRHLGDASGVTLRSEQFLSAKYVDMATYQDYVGAMKIKAKPRRPGRPRVSPLPRTEQLRRAKRAQRERDREAGFVLCQFKLKTPVAERLRRALAIPGFDAELGEFLNEALVDVRDYPNLQLLCWNRADRMLADRDAFGLYERNWRFVDTRNLSDHERGLIERLAAKYGNGLLNV